MVPLILGNPCMRVQDRGENHEPGRVQGAQQDSPTTELDLGFVLFRVRIWLPQRWILIPFVLLGSARNILYRDYIGILQLL